MDIYRGRQADRQIYKQVGIQILIHAGRAMVGGEGWRKTGDQICKTQTARQAGSQAHRQAGRQAGRLAEAVLTVCNKLQIATYYTFSLLIEAKH